MFDAKSLRLRLSRSSECRESRKKPLLTKEIEVLQITDGRPEIVATSVATLESPKEEGGLLRLFYKQKDSLVRWIAVGDSVAVRDECKTMDQLMSFLSPPPPEDRATNNPRP